MHSFALIYPNTVILTTTNSKDIESDFKPEVLGRLDAVLEYSSLGPEIMHDLIAKQVRLLNERLADKKIKIELEPEVYEQLTERGYDPRYGARPLASVFSKLIVRPLAKTMLAHHSSQSHLLAKWNPSLDAVEFE